MNKFIVWDKVKGEWACARMFALNGDGRLYRYVQGKEWEMVRDIRYQVYESTGRLLPDTDGNMAFDVLEGHVLVWDSVSGGKIRGLVKWTDEKVAWVVEREHFDLSLELVLKGNGISILCHVRENPNWSETEGR